MMFLSKLINEQGERNINIVKKWKETKNKK